MAADATLRLGFAFSAGLATFFAPCAYPMLPGYVAFYLGHEGEDSPAARRGRLGRLRRAIVVGGVASLGFFLVYLALAGVAAAVGARALADVALLELIVGSLLVVVGVPMAAGRVSPSAVHVALPRRRNTYGGFLLFGVGYAVAAAGCTAPIFLAIAGVALGAGPVGALLTFGAYAGGMAVLMVVVTVGVALGRDALRRPFGTDLGSITRVAGVLLALAGAAQIWLYLVEFGGLARLGL